MSLASQLVNLLAALLLLIALLIFVR